MSDHTAIFLVQDSAVVLSTRMSGIGGYFVLGSLIESRKVLSENMIVACSRPLIVIRSGNLDLKCFRVLYLIEIGHSSQHQNLSSRQCASHPVRHASPGTVQL